MPRHRPAPRPARLASPRGALLAAALAVGLAGCAGVSSPGVSFDPAASCTADGQMPGAYPELEALLPAEYEGSRPNAVDSGRSCTPEGLGALAASGVSELRFAGATWDLGAGRGLTIAVFRAPGLDAARMHDFYAAGAREARRTERIDTSDVTVAGRAGKRLDVLQGDGTGQTVVTWPSAEPDTVNVLLAADIGDERVLAALEDFGDR